jgi:hypothetical protein
VRVVEVEAGDRIVAFSDGFIEAHNPEGEMFGLERLVATLASEADPDSMFDGLLRTLGDFVGEGALGDDLSLVEITCDPAWAQARSSEAPRAFHPRAPMRWSISIELVPDTLRSVDPLPLVMHLLMDLQGLQEHREQLYAVLMELFSNALDHGLLGLDSALKQTPEGFVRYYERPRLRSLAGLRAARGERQLLRSRHPTAQVDLRAPRVHRQRQPGRGGLPLGQQRGRGRFSDARLTQVVGARAVLR